MNPKYKLANGMEIELTERDMHGISALYVGKLVTDGLMAMNEKNSLLHRPLTKELVEGFAAEAEHQLLDAAEGCNESYFEAMAWDLIVRAISNCAHRLDYSAAGEEFKGEGELLEFYEAVEKRWDEFAQFGETGDHALVKLGEAPTTLWPERDVDLAVRFADSALGHEYIFGGVEYEERKCGENLTWSYADGTLTISGTGDMWDWEEVENPWCNFAGDITSVVVEDGLTSIASEAFEGCYNLRSVTIPKTVTKICPYAFASCESLASIEIPKSVEVIWENAFLGCDDLADITVDAENPYLCSVDGVLYSKDMKTLIAYPMGKWDTSFTVPDGVEVISFRAFAFCEKDLTSIELPDGLKVIRKGAFEGCANLESISIPSSLATIEGCAFEGCRNLERVVIPNRKTQIKETSFDKWTNIVRE